MGRLTRRAEADGVKAVWYGKRDVFLEGEVGYAEADKLAHYEDLEEAGRLIELPCALNTELYFVGQKSDGTYEICSKTLFTYDLCVLFGKHIGKGFYLTKEEAERKLEELEGVKE